MVVPEDVAIALEAGNFAVVRHWLTSGARDANDVDSNGFTLLQRTLVPHQAHMPPCACMGPSRVEMMRLLIEHGAEVSHTPNGIEPIFYCACAEEVRVLLDAGGDVNVQLSAPNGPGLTPLMYYLQFAPTFPAMVDFAKFLVKCGADLSLTSFLGDAETLVRRTCEHMQRFQMQTEEHNLEVPHFLAEMDLAASRHLADWLADVRRAGGYAKFVREPRVALARLRLLCERGRASPPDGGATKEDRALERVFGPRTPLPRGVFWLVVQYWRSDRDV